MRMKGFTLIELLAVIIILAIILSIAVPSITGILKNSTKNAFETDAKMVLTAINYKQINDKDFNPISVNETNINTLLGLSNDNYQALCVMTINGETYIIIQGKNKWINLVAYGTYKSVNVEDNSNYGTITNQLGYNSSKGVNEPRLVSGMTPIKWNGSSWVDTTSRDTSWYNYTNKQWANAKTSDGSMWVWIPRYIYKISSGWHSNVTGIIDIQFSKGTDDNWNSGSIGNINTDTTANASNNTWTNEPAFDFGSNKLTGIWVAKFEATAAEGVANGYTADSSCPITGDDVTTKTIQVLPNVSSWRCVNIGNMFTATRNMETNSTYGWGISGSGIDTHMMKNTEWGAVTYLSKSNYGQGTNEIWTNNSQTYTTGCAGNATSSASYNGCQNTYDTTNGQKASTTGNIYGIYDMAGGSWEYVAAYLNNANGNLGRGSSIVNAASQYKDVYTAGSTDDQPTNYGLAINQKGDAVYETSNAGTGGTTWFGDYSLMTYTSNPWFSRSGTFSHGALDGIFFFHCHWGGALSGISFHPVLAVNLGI